MSDSRQGAMVVQEARTTAPSRGLVAIDGKAARLADLRRRIASGDYEPDAKAIAREILRRGL